MRDDNEGFYVFSGARFYVFNETSGWIEKTGLIDYATKGYAI